MPPTIGTALIDHSLRVSAASAEFAGLLGIPAEQLPGLDARSLLPAARPDLVTLLAAALAGGEPILDIVVETPPADGRRWLLSLHPLRSQAGVTLGVDLTLQPYDGRPASEPARADPHQAGGPFRAIFEQADIGIVLARPSGELVAANPGFCAIVGYEPEELRQLRLRDLAHPDDRNLDSDQLARLRLNEHAPTVEQRYIRKDGGVVWVRLTRSLVRGPGGETPFELTLVQHISDYKHAAELARQAAGRNERLQALSAALSRALTPEAVASVVIQIGLDALGATAGTVMQIDPDGATLSVLAVSGLDEAVRQRWAKFPLALATPLSDAARRGEPVWLENLAARARIYPHLARETPYTQERAWAALPLALNQHVLGALGLVFDRSCDFDAEERAFLSTVAALCAQALERARLTAAERAALAAADEALALLDTVIDSAPIGLAFLDLDFRYRRINTTLARINGLPAAEHIGRRAVELHPQIAPLWERYWQQVIETGEPIIGLELDGLALGISTYVLVDYYPVRGAGGELLGVGIIVQDISGRKAAEQERLQLLERERAAREAEEAARARAEEAVRLRDAFLSVAAHELKTPLTALIGQAQLLRRRLSQAGTLEEANERSIAIVVDQAQRLNQLINDLLDGARLDSGQLLVTRSPLDLGRLLRRVVDEQRQGLVRHSIDVEIGGEPLIVAGDNTRLEQVLQNLLSNAVKYSPNGGSILVRAYAAGGCAVLSVRDQGIGIDPEAIPRLFERFYRAPSAERAGVGGVGVGLYVVREIVRQHGGTIDVESANSAGSIFTVTLPLAS